jgi:hypothetical protein
VTWFKTDPNDADSDGDGIDDDVENPLAGFDADDPFTGRDTDSDGLIDALDWDSDNDGLDDGYEELNGDGVSYGDDGDGVYEGGTYDETDAYDADSDNDGLSDGFEVRITCTNPNAAQNDGDPIAAGDEVMTYKTDFFDPDTDGDDLNEGLLTGTDQADYNTDGGYGMPWADSSVDALDRDADGDGIWDGDEVAGTYGHVTLPYDYDTDNDGLRDGEEVYIWGTDPTDADCDIETPLNPGGGDGLTDGEEALTYGTDPLDPDTDGDLVIDGTEIDWWQAWAPNVWPPAPNPLDPDTDGDGIKDGVTITGYYYDTAGEWTSWSFYEGPEDSELVPDGFPNILDPDSDWREQHSPGAGYDYYDFHDRTEYAYRLFVATMKAERGEWRDFVDDQPLHPGDPDTDGDGYTDWSEVVRGTDPLNGQDFSAVPYTPEDTDADGLWDIEEMILEGTTTGTMWADTDFDDDGLADSDELHPTLPKLKSSWGAPPWPYVWFEVDAVAQAWPTSPKTMHSETDLGISPSDGITDFEEVQAGVDTYVTNPHYNDTDGDGIADNTEVLRGYDPTDFDMDDDRLTDHQEDQDADGILDSPIGYATSYTAETDPQDGDTDDDGIYDGNERTYHTYQRNMDTDGDGLIDGLEVGYAAASIGVDTDGPTFGAGDQDPTTKTDPRLTDSDFDCLTEGQEDLNLDGEYVLGGGETDAQNRDSDDDNLYDYYEYNGCVASAGSPCNFYTFCDNSGDPTDPDDPDTDADGMPDYVEYEQGCDPDNDTDTDNDGAFDGSEYDGVTYWTDPTMLDTDMDGHDDYVGVLSGVDGIPDEVESLDDCDGDTIVNAMDVDSDNDWIRDLDEGDTTGDDDEADGYVNILDGDRDNDFLVDPIEMGLAIYDPRDMDTDDDGLYDGEEYYQYFMHDVGWSCGGRDSTVVITMTDPGVDNQSRDTDRDGWITGVAYYFHDGFEAGRAAGIPADAGTTPVTPGTDDDPQIWDFDGTANSDPRYRDTDFDGLWDFDEDTDWDGNDAEVGVGLAESDPWDADTDDDGLFDSYEVDYDGVAMAIDCDSDDGGTGDLLPDGLELGLLFEMPRQLQAFWMWPGPTSAQQYDYTNWTNQAGGSACGLWAANRSNLDTVDAGKYKTDPLDADTDEDSLTDGVEDEDQDGFRDGNTPFDLSSDWATVGETDPNEWDTDRGGEDDGTEVGAADDPLLRTDGDWDLDIDPEAVDAVGDVLPVGSDGAGVVPGSSGTSTFRVWVTDPPGDNPDPDGPSSVAVIDSVYVRVTSLHWVGQHSALRDATPDVGDWFHYSHVSCMPQSFRLGENPGVRSSYQDVAVTVDVPWGAMPGYYEGYVQVETRRYDSANNRNMEQELPDDFILLRVWVAPHKDLDVCDDDDDPRGVGTVSDPWDFPDMAAQTEMHLVGAPAHRDTIAGMFRVANPNTYPDGTGPYWPYPGQLADGTNDYNGMPAIPVVGRTWDVPWNNDAQGNVDLTGSIRAVYAHSFGPADPTGAIWFTKRGVEGPSSVLKSGFNLATTDSFNVRVLTTDLPEGFYSGLVRVYEDVDLPYGSWQTSEVSDTFRLKFWLTKPDLDIDDDYANMAGNELTIDIDPENYVGDVVEEVLMWNPGPEMPIGRNNVDPWDGPSMEDIYDFYYYDTSDEATGTKVSSRHHQIPMYENRPSPTAPLSFWVYSDEYSDPQTPRYPVRVWLYSDKEDTLLIDETKKFYVQVPTFETEVWELPAGTYRPWHPEAFNVVPDDDSTGWTWQYGQGIVPITVRGMATGMRYDRHDWAARSDFFDYEDGVVYNPSRVDTLEQWMDYFYLIVNVDEFVDVEFDLSEPWSVTGNPGQTVCGDALVRNLSNTEVTSVALEATNLLGSAYGGIILSDYIALPNDFALPWPDDGSGILEICVTIPVGTRADTYEGEVTIVAAGEGEEWIDTQNTLPIRVVVTCVPGMDVVETSYGVVGNVMALTPGAGGSGSKQFELCNLGDCDITGVSYTVSGLPSGITVTATHGSVVPWHECILGTVTASWTSPWPVSGLYHGTMTITANGGLLDTFGLDVLIAPDMLISEDAYDVIDNMMTLIPDAPGDRGTDSGQFELVNIGVTDLSGITGVAVTGLPSWVTATVTIAPTCGWNSQIVGSVSVSWDDSHPEVAAGEYLTSVTVTANGGLSDNFILKAVITEVTNAAFVSSTLNEVGVAGELLATGFTVENTGNILLEDGRVSFAVSNLVGAETGSMIPNANIEIVPGSAEIPHEGEVDFYMGIDVPEGLLGQDYEGHVDLYVDGEWVDMMEVTVTLERGDVIAIYPNPYRMGEHEGGITIALGDVGEDLTIKVFDMFGALVADLTPDTEARGTNIQWDLNNDDGKAVASGMYIVTIDTGDKVVTRKIMVIK